MKKSTIIEINHLVYKDIFLDISISIPKGSFVAISGTNMSGKTMLIKILSGLVTVNNVVYYNAKLLEETNKKDFFKEVGVILSEEKQVFNFSTVENELFNILENLTIDQNKKILKYQQVIKTLGLESILSKNPNQLNYFNKIKVLLATCMLTNTKVLLLDNICVNMSKKETSEILNILNQINQEEKITIVLATGNLNEVLNVDYLYILNKGKIALEGAPLEILKEDNKINKIGLELPFLIDLSVKLQDYDLINELILDMDRMADTLWK